MDLVLWIWPECRQGGGGVQNPEKLCRRHLGMTPPSFAARTMPDRPTESGWGMLEKSKRSRKEMKSLALVDEIRVGKVA